MVLDLGATLFSSPTPDKAELLYSSSPPLR